MIPSFKIGGYDFVDSSLVSDKATNTEQQKMLGLCRSRFQPEVTTEVTATDPKGDRTGFAFSAYDNGKLVGGVVFYGTKTDGTAFPMIGFPELSASDEATLVAQCAEYFLNNKLDGYQITKIQFYYLNEPTLTRAQDTVINGWISALTASALSGKFKVAQTKDVRLKNRFLVTLSK